MNLWKRQKLCGWLSGNDESIQIICEWRWTMEAHVVAGKGNQLTGGQNDFSSASLSLEEKLFYCYYASSWHARYAV